MVAYQVNGSRVEWNPAAARRREPTGKRPDACVTECGNVNVKARASRGARSAYGAEDSANSRGQIITRAEYERVAALPDAHIAVSRTVVVDGLGGPDRKPGTRARLITEAAGAAATEAAATTTTTTAAAGAVERTGDPGFGHDVAAAVPGLDESLVKSLGSRGRESTG